MCNLLDYLFHFGRVVGIIQIHGRHQLLHQHLVDLLRLHPLERQVQMPRRRLQRVHVHRRSLGQEIPDESLEVLVDARPIPGYLALADHPQVLH